jgi:hypothetical protein
MRDPGGRLTAWFETRDNEFVYIAKAFANQAEFFAAIDQVASALPPQVVSVTPRLGTDWEGEPAVFLEVILADNAVPRPELLSFTKQVRRAIVLQVRPLEEWGVLPHFRFLTQTERSRMREPAWA